MKFVYKMGKWLNRNKIFLILILAIFLSPIIINIIYQYPKKYITTVWDGTNLLEYCGSILSSLVTLIALYVTIKHEQKMREDDRRVENETQKNERKLDTRVFISLDPHILFTSFEDFRNYANDIGAYRAYCYPQWEHIEDGILKSDEEFDYITEYGKYKLQSVINRQEHTRILAILVVNYYDKPVMNFRYKMDVEYINQNINIFEKHYGESVIEVFSPGLKVFYLIPVNLHGNLVSIKNIDITYLTISGEEICYHRNQIDDEVTESYVIDGNEIFPSKLDITHSSMFFDIRKFRESI